MACLTFERPSLTLNFDNFTLESINFSQHFAYQRDVL